MPLQGPPYSRIDLACEQLDVAIELFFSERSFVSSLTLAGAAEEVLGNELKNKGKLNAMTTRHAELKRLLPRAKVHPPEWKHFVEKHNYARNAAKHLANIEAKSAEYDPLFRAEPRTAAINMILRAIQNQDLLGMERTAQVVRFYLWHQAARHSEEEGAA